MNVFMFKCISVLCTVYSTVSAVVFLMYYNLNMVRNECDNSAIRKIE